MRGTGPRLLLIAMLGSGCDKTADGAPAQPGIGTTPSPSTEETPKADPDAIPMVVATLERLAAEPELLEGEPQAVADQVGLADERLRLAVTSTHTADAMIRGIIILPHRTALPAAALASALGLQDPKARNVDSWQPVWHVQAGGTTRIPWNGLELELELSSPERGAWTQPLGKLEVTFVRVMPKHS